MQVSITEWEWQKYQFDQSLSKRKSIVLSAQEEDMTDKNNFFLCHQFSDDKKDKMFLPWVLNPAYKSWLLSWLILWVVKVQTCTYAKDDLWEHQRNETALLKRAQNILPCNSDICIFLNCGRNTFLRQFGRNNLRQQPYLRLKWNLFSCQEHSR